MNDKETIEKLRQYLQEEGIDLKTGFTFSLNEIRVPTKHDILTEQQILSILNITDANSVEIIENDKRNYNVIKIGY